MKKVFLTAFVLIAATVVSAQDNIKTVSSKAGEAVVFFKGAQLTHTATVSVPQGQSVIVFEDLPAGLDASSVQLKGEGNFTLLSVSFQVNYLKSQEKPKEVIRIEDSVSILQQELDYQKSMLTVYQQEEGMLLANKVIGGQDVGVKVAELKEASEFFRIRLTDILNKKLAIGQKIKKIETRLSMLSNQLSVLNANKPQPTGEVFAEVMASSPVQGKFSLTYYISSAGWVPTYDLRVTDINKPIELNFRANIYQSTGFDWKNINLTLSTGNPAQSGTKPVLQPWYVSFYTPYAYDARTYEAAPQSASEETKYPARKEKMDEGGVAQGISDYTVVNEQQTTLEYVIGIPCNIPSDGKYHMAEIRKNSLPAIYEYFAAPKLDPDAYLLARVSGWEKYDIMSGEVNLFFEGTYVGKSYIDTRVTSDTLEFSLGKDKNIVVKREQLMDFSSTKLLGTNKRETFTYEISIRNKKKQDVSLVLEDQIPLSRDKDIEIEVTEISGAVKNNDNGKLSWKLLLKPAEEKKIRISYSIKYPKDKTIVK